MAGSISEFRFRIILGLAIDLMAVPMSGAFDPLFLNSQTTPHQPGRRQSVGRGWPKVKTGARAQGFVGREFTVSGFRTITQVTPFSIGQSVR